MLVVPTHPKFSEFKPMRRDWVGVSPMVLDSAYVTCPGKKIHQIKLLAKPKAARDCFWWLHSSTGVLCAMDTRRVYAKSMVPTDY